MCTYSMIMDMGMKMPQQHWTPQTWPPFKRLADEAKRFDDETGQPDCEDKDKVAWLEKIEKRLASLEQIMADAVPRHRPAVDAAAPLRWCPEEYADVGGG